MSDSTVSDWANWFLGLIGISTGEPSYPIDNINSLWRQIEEADLRLQQAVDGRMFRPTEILDRQVSETSRIHADRQRVATVSDPTLKKTLTDHLDNSEKLLVPLVTKSMARAEGELNRQVLCVVNAISLVAEGIEKLGSEPDAKKKAADKVALYKDANKAMVSAEQAQTDWLAQIKVAGSLPGASKLKKPLTDLSVALQKLEDAMPDLLPEVTSVGQKVDDDAPTIDAPEEFVIKEGTEDKLLRDCKDWAVAKQKYGRYKNEMQKLANHRKAVVDEWLETNLGRYGLKLGTGVGWVAVGSNDPTSDYDISVNKHGTVDGKPESHVKYDYEMVNEFNEHFRGVYGCETGTIFDTNLYASAPPLKLEHKGVDTREEAAARQDIAASNDIGALMKQRRYMSAEEFNSYRGEVVEGLTGNARDEVDRRFQEADDNYRISVLKTIEVMVPVLEKKIKEGADKLKPPVAEDIDAEELHKSVLDWQALIDEWHEVNAARGLAMIEATDKAEHLAHEFEHHCKDETTFATNTIYANATGELRQAEGKVKELNDCRDKLDTLLAAQREVAELKSKSPQDLKKIEETETLIANGQEDLAKAIEALGRSGLKAAAQAVRAGDFDTALAKLQSESPDLFKELGKALALSMFFANEAYQSGGPFQHVVYAGQAVETDVKNTNEDAKKLVVANKTDETELKKLKASENPDPEAIKKFETDIKERNEALKQLVDAERIKRRNSLSREERLESFNEQLGDFLKDLAHYGDADPGVAIIQSSKYLDRMLDAAKLLNEADLFDGDQTLKTEIEKQVGRIKTINDALIAARKGKIKMQPINPEAGVEIDEVEQRRAMACEIMKDWGIKSVASLHRTYADLGKRVNVVVRKAMANG